MKIRHSDLENLRADPRRWADSQISPSGRPSMSYAHLARMSIYKYHRTKSLDEALLALAKYAASFDRNNDARLDEAERRLTTYATWMSTAAPTVAKVKLNVRFPIANDMFLAGEVARVDLDLGTGGYNAVLLHDKQTDWRSELRMPLLQLAVAARLERDPSDMAVGVQQMDDWNDIEVVQFSKSQLVAAFNETKGLCLAAAKALKRA